MKGKEALRILCECANGEKKLLFSDSLDLEQIISKRLEKLEKLEDIEEELGIPLEVLFKALKDGIYYDHKHRNPESISFRFCCNDLIVEYICYGYTDYDYLEIKDYGKTWALTKEELE